MSGWMFSRSLWEELSPKWPKGYWDDWLREPEQRKGRHIIRPEICRTFHFGAHGVSNSQYSEVCIFNWLMMYQDIILLIVTVVFEPN